MENRVTQDLNNDLIKLIRYVVVTIVRGDEQVVESGLKIATEAMTSEAFVAWVVSELGGRPAYPLDADQYLRVTYRVLESWPKQDLNYEEKQLRLLHGIERCIC